MANKSMVETPYIETDRYTATNTFNNDPVDYSIKGDFKLSELKNLATSQLYTGGVQADLSGLISSDSPLRKNDSDNRFSSHAGFYDIHDSHSLSQTQKWIPKYDQFVFGLDNKEIQAQKDGWKEDWGKGLTRMATDTVAGAIGGTVGTVYGLATAIATGSIDGFHDNAIMNTLSDWQDETTLSNQVYETHREEDMSLVRKLGNSSFWADKVVGTVGFTLGAIASEAIWAAIPGVGWGKIAATLPGKLGRFAVSHADDVARLGLTSKTAATQAGLRAGVRKAMSGLAKESDEYLKMANILGKETGKKLDDLRGLVSASVSDESMKIIQSYTKSAARNADLVKNARFMVTSAGYEASVEEKNFRKLAIQDFVDYHKLNGTKPTDEELDNFSKTLEENSNKVFLANMAILGVSNAALFGKYFGVKSPLSGTSEWVNKNIFKLGTKVGKDGTYRALNAGWYNKAAKKLTGLGKNALSEGVFEEGGQGIASNTISNYIKSSYDKDYMSKTDSMYKAFTDAVGHQFNTKEGQEEILIGALIGGLFGAAGGLGRKPAQDTYKGQEQVAEFQNKATKYIKENLTPLVYTSLDLSSKVAMANRNQAITEELQEAQAKGNALAIEQAKTKGLISLYEQAYSLEKGDFFEGVLGKEMSQIPTRDIAREWGISVEEAKDYKEATIENMQKTVADYKANREFAENIFGNGRIGGITKDKAGNELSTQNLINATAFGITMSNTSKKVLNEAHTVFDTLLANGTITEEVRNNIFGTITLSKVDNKTRERRDELIERKNTIDASIEELTEAITQAGLNQETQSDVEELKDKSMKLKEAQASLSEVEQALQVLDQEIVQKYAKGEQGTLKTQTFIDGLTDLKDNIYSLPEKDKIRVNALLETMIDAVEHIKSYDDMVDKLINPDFRFRTYQGIFGKVIAPRLSIAEATREALLNWYEKPNNDITIFDINSESVEEVQEEEEDEDDIDNPPTVQQVQPTPVPPPVNAPVSQPIVPVASDTNNQYVPSVEKIDVRSAIRKLIQRMLENRQKGHKISDTLDQLYEDLDAAKKELVEVKKKFKQELKALEPKLNYSEKSTQRKGAEKRVKEIKENLKAYEGFVSAIKQQIQDQNKNLTALEEAQDALREQIAYYKKLHARDVNTKGAIIMEEQMLEEAEQEISEKISLLKEYIGNLQTLLDDLLKVFDKAIEMFYKHTKLTRPKWVKTPGDLMSEIVRNEKGLTKVYQQKAVEVAERRIEAQQPEIGRVTDDISQAKTTLEESMEDLDRVIREKGYLQELLQLADDVIVNVNSMQPNTKPISVQRAYPTPVPAEKTASERIQEIYSNDEYLQRSDEFEADTIEDVEPITQEDIDRYAELIERDDLDDQETLERNRLRSKLFRYNFARGSYYGETNLLELIELNRSLNEKAEENPLQEIKEEDTAQMIDETINLGEVNTSYKVSNTIVGAYTSEDGTKLHNYTLASFFELAKRYLGDNIQMTVTPDNKKTRVVKDSAGLEKLQSQNDRIGFSIEDGSGNQIMSGYINQKSRITFDSGSISEMFGGNIISVAIKGQKTGYSTVYEKNIDGNYSPIEVTDPNGKQHDREAANNVKVGDELKAVHSFKDRFNQLLLNRLYGSEKAHFKKTGKTREETALIDPEYLNRANIELQSKGKYVGGLKTSISNTSKNYASIRESAIQNGSHSIGVTDVYIHQPILKLDENGVPILHDIHLNDKNVLGFHTLKVKSNGELEYSDNVNDVDRSFVGALANKYNIIHYAVFKQGNNNIAFPIEFDPPTVDLSLKIEEEINKGGSNERISTVINRIIDVYNVDHQKINDISEIDYNKFENVKMYDDISRASVARSVVDPNNAFLSPKFRLDTATPVSTTTNAQPVAGNTNTKNNNICDNGL